MAYANWELLPRERMFTTYIFYLKLYVLYVTELMIIYI